MTRTWNEFTIYSLTILDKHFVSLQLIIIKDGF